MNKNHQKSFPGHKNAGFTLIELLVVVLIIGILAAVAVPKYEKAVEKSRAAAVFQNIKSLADSLERHYMANGSYPHDTMDGLDLSLTGCQPDTTGRYYCADSWYDYNGGGSSQTRFSITGFTRVYGQGGGTMLQLYLNHDAEPGKITCSSGISGVCNSLDFVTK